MPNLTPYDTNFTGGLIGMIDYINTTTNFLFFPAFLLLVFTIVVILNRTNIFLGFSLASLMLFIISLILYSVFTTFSFHFVLMSIALVVLSLIFNLLWG